MALTFNISDVSSSLGTLYSTTTSRLAHGTAAVAAEMEAYAKQNAPWTDRTGNARRTLSGFVLQQDENTMLVGIAGHMYYSPDLEMRYGGRYAILGPTVDMYVPNIMRAVVSAAVRMGV